jgi:hypothetical protein
VPTARDPRRLAAAVMAIAVVVALPWPVAAAEGDASPAPSASVAPPPTPAPSSGPVPSVSPTAAPTATPRPSASPTPRPTPTTTPTPTPAPTPTPTPAPARVTVTLNLYKPYTVARQYTSYWCVPANAQTMLNLVLGRRDRTYATQAKYDRWLKRYNRYKYVTRGNDVHGWATLLDYSIGGPWHYHDRSYATQSVAIARIVESLDRTRHPVGVVVDRGTHAWTVVGYRATMEPGRPETKVIVGLYVSGSLATRDPHPYRYMLLGDFRRRFTRYHEWQRSVIWEGKYVIVSE